MLTTAASSGSASMSLSINIFQVLIHIPLVPFTIRHANFDYLFQIFIHVRTILSGSSLSAPSKICSTMTSPRLSSTWSLRHLLKETYILFYSLSKQMTDDHVTP